MTNADELSANEIEALVLKAARGGGLPLGHCEDLAAVSRFLDLDALSECPCSGEAPFAITLQSALDLLAAGSAPQEVHGDSALIAAYVEAAQSVMQKRLIWTTTSTGAVFQRFEAVMPAKPQSKGRRALPPTLALHLTEMAAKLQVPETDASRQAGAGAGLTDND